MKDAEPEGLEVPRHPPQPLVGFMTNEEWQELLSHVNGLIQEMERLPFPEAKERVFELLAGVDAIHREALRRLVRLFKEGVLEKVVSDPAIHTLMELYDLLPPHQPAGDDQLAATPKPRFPNIPIRVVPATGLGAPPRPKYPRWLPVLKNLDELPSGRVKDFELDAHKLLLCRVGEEFFALESLCAQDGSTLTGATLSSYTLSCPNHSGCLYDIRQGARIAGSERLACYPVKREPDGRVLVGLDVPFEPRLPSF